MPSAKLNKQSFILEIRGGSGHESGTDMWLLASQSNNTAKIIALSSDMECITHFFVAFQKLAADFFPSLKSLELLFL